MPSIDETELARLEALAAHYTNVVTLDNVSIPHQIIKAVPALIAEIRRLRRDYECSEKSLQRHEHMVAELMEKVEAWEWFEECFEAMQWLVPMGPNRGNACEEAVISTLDAQKRAAHADRE